jgi:hypothetical protein
VASASATYRLLRNAVVEGLEVHCVYRTKVRVLGPHILGHSKGVAKLLAFQFGGESNTKLPTGGEWRCFTVDEIRDAHAQAGEWRARAGHRRPNTCVEEIDVERRLED